MMSLYGFGAPQFYDPVVDTGEPKAYRVGAGARAAMQAVQAGQANTATTRDPLLRLQATTSTSATQTTTTSADNGQTHTTTDTGAGGGPSGDPGTEYNPPSIATKLAPGPLPPSRFGLTDLLIVLGLVGAGTGAYFLFRKKKPKAGVAGARRRRR